jgi:hypothetical protein
VTEQEKKTRKQVEREYIIEMLDGTTETITHTSLRSAKKYAWVMHNDVKDVRRADGVVSKPWDSKWNDNTRKQRQQDRRNNLSVIAQAAGFASWDDLATAAGRGVYIEINKPDKS